MLLTKLRCLLPQNLKGKLEKWQKLEDEIFYNRTMVFLFSRLLYSTISWMLEIEIFARIDDNQTSMNLDLKRSAEIISVILSCARVVIFLLAIKFKSFAKLVLPLEVS